MLLDVALHDAKAEGEAGASESCEPSLLYVEINVLALFIPYGGLVSWREFFHQLDHLGMVKAVYLQFVSEVIADARDEDCFTHLVSRQNFKGAGHVDLAAKSP